MSCFSGPRSPMAILQRNTVGSFWNPNILSSLFSDTAGTTPAVVDGEVQRMNDLGRLGNHMTSYIGVKGAYTCHGPTLRKESGTNTYYLEFDGIGANLQNTGISGTWPQITAAGGTGITVGVGYWMDSTQPIGTNGTWLGTHSLGNFTSKWNFGLRLIDGLKHYCTVRNNANDAWLAICSDNSALTTVLNAAYKDKKILYIAEGTFGAMTSSARNWVGRDLVGAFFNNTVTDTENDLPIDLYNQFAIGARAPNNDNWIAGRFYVGAMIGKSLSDEERGILHDYLYINMNR